MQKTVVVHVLLFFGGVGGGEGGCRGSEGCPIICADLRGTAPVCCSSWHAPPLATPRAHSALHPHLWPHPGLTPHCIPTSGHTQGSFRTASPPPATPRAHSALHPHLWPHPVLIPHCIPTSGHTQGSFHTLQPCPQRFTGGDIRLLVGCHPKETLPCCLVTLAVFSSACSD